MTESNRFEEANRWEASRMEAIARSERRAWWVAYAAVIGLLLALAALMLLMPLKQTIPFLYRENTATGVVDVITTLAQQSVTYDDVRDKYWIAQYVRQREGYEWYGLGDAYRQVVAWSAPTVAAPYAKLFDGPQALDKTNGNRVLTQIAIVSLVPNGHGSATVRFTRTTRHLDQTTDTPAVSHWVATLTYQYGTPAQLTAAQRLTNPFAFQVLAYRVDPESLAGATP